MSAQRKAIRFALAALFRDDAVLRELVGDDIYHNRSEPIWSEYELPAICVYATRETVEISDASPRKYRRDLELRVEAQAQGVDADEVLDEIGDRIERIVGRSNNLTHAKDSQVSDIILSSEAIEYRSEGENRTAALVITYTATYYTCEPDELSEDPVDSFDTVNTRVSLGNEQAVPEQAEDNIEVAA